MNTISRLDLSPPNHPHLASWILILWVASSAWALDVGAQERLDCPTCVEDVVVETVDGAWISGYIYWSRPPFRYLDLRQPGDLLRLQRHGQVDNGSRVWADAVSVSREYWPERLGDPPPLPPAPPGQLWGARKEVALLVGTPRTVSVHEVRRIFPRIGSGAPAIEVTRLRLLDVLETNLPLQPMGGSECLGCPMTVEDVTLVLTSGEWVSGLMGWHVAAHLQGYDLRKEKLVDGFWAAGDLDGHLEIWPEGVSGPRRRFKSPAFLDQERNLQGGVAFHRVPESVLLTQEPRRVPVDEVAFLLPGPSRMTYPLRLDRVAARQLLLEEPTVSLSYFFDASSAVCLSYGLEPENPTYLLHRLAELCRELSPAERRQQEASGNFVYVQSPWWARNSDHPAPSSVVSETQMMVIHFDGGT